MTARPVDASTAGAFPEGAGQAARGLRDELHIALLERRIVHQTARERLSEPIHGELLAQEERLIGEAIGEQQRPGVSFCSPHQGTITREENALVIGSNCYEMGIGRGRAGDQRVIPGSTKPTAETDEHLVTEETHERSSPGDQA